MTTDPPDGEGTHVHRVFHNPPALPHDDVAATLERALRDGAEQFAAAQALVGVALDDDDREFVEHWCLRIAARSRDAQLLGLAGLCLGHLARRFGHLGDEAIATARGLAARHEADPADVGANAVVGLEDIEHYLRLGPTTETWRLGGPDSAAMPPGIVAGILQLRINAGDLETWLTSSAGRSLAFVTNTNRAMVMLLDEPGDPGEHATDPGADGVSDGYVLADGQDDEYPDADTVPLTEALRLVEHILKTGSWPADAHVAVDR